MALELVRMRHSKLDHVGELPVTTRQAFDDVWKAKGWEIDEDAPLPVVSGSDGEPAPGEAPADDTSGSRRAKRS